MSNGYGVFPSDPNLQWEWSPTDEGVLVGTYPTAQATQPSQGFWGTVTDLAGQLGTALISQLFPQPTQQPQTQVYVVPRPTATTQYLTYGAAAVGGGLLAYLLFRR